MSLDLLTRYIEHALTFERMADAEQNQGLKVDLERQATAYRLLAANRARKLGLPQRACRHVVNTPPNQPGGVQSPVATSTQQPVGNNARARLRRG